MSFVKYVLGFLGIRTARTAWIVFLFFLTLFFLFLWVLWSNPNFVKMSKGRVLVLAFLVHWVVLMLIPCWALFTKKGRFFLSSEP